MNARRQISSLDAGSAVSAAAVRFGAIGLSQVVATAVGRSPGSDVVDHQGQGLTSRNDIAQRVCDGSSPAFRLHSNSRSVTAEARDPVRHQYGNFHFLGFARASVMD